MEIRGHRCYLVDEMGVHEYSCGAHSFEIAIIAQALQKQGIGALYEGFGQRLAAVQSRCLLSVFLFL